MSGVDEYACPAEDGSCMTLTMSDYGITYRISRFGDYFYRLEGEAAGGAEGTYSAFCNRPPLTGVASY